MLETISQPMVEPKHGTTTQHMRDMEVYQTYKCKDRVARMLMLSSMRNDMMLRFENNRLPWLFGTLSRYNLVVLQPLGCIG